MSQKEIEDTGKTKHTKQQGYHSPGIGAQGIGRCVNPGKQEKFRHTVYTVQKELAYIIQVMPGILIIRVKFQRPFEKEYRLAEMRGLKARAAQIIA